MDNEILGNAGADAAENKAEKQPYVKPRLHMLSAASGTQAKPTLNPTEASPSTGPS